MKNLFEPAASWLKKNKKIALFSLTALGLAAVFVFANSVWAEAEAAGSSIKIGSFLSVIISTVCSWITWGLGLILGLLVHVLIGVAGYNDFINSGAVINGWVIIRDICNMFFILILLVIAFSVILRVDGYDIKKMIPKLLIMAVLINFSKTICGLIIDAAQVIMMTFVTSFKDVGGASLVEMFGMKNYLAFSKVEEEGVKNLDASTAIGYLVAIVFLLISVIVVLALLGVLVMRMIMLWIYVVLSPLAFFLASFPQGKSYSQKWWKEFTENVIVGPVLAFFLWLAFVTLGPAGDGSGVLLLNSENAPVGPTAIFNADDILKYVISIGMLLGGLIIAQGMAGAVGGMAGKALGNIQAGAGWAKKKSLGGVKAAGLAVGGAGLAAGKTLGGTADRLAGRAVGGILNVGGKDRKVSQALAMGGLVGATVGGIKNIPGTVMNKFKTSAEKNRELDKARAAGRFNKDKGYEMEHNGAAYRINKQGVYQEWDKEGKKHKTGPGALLQRNGKSVGAMSAVRASFVDAKESGTSASRVASNAASDKKVSEEMEKIKSSGVSNDDATRLLNSFATSAPKKMALSLFLASKKGFKDKAEKDKARQSLSGNSILTAKFDDEVLKNQVHLSYDLDAKKKNASGKMVDDKDTQAREKTRFKKDLSKGKVDVSNLPKDAIKNTAFQSVLREWAMDKNTGSEEKYARIMEKNAENGGGENSENVAKAVKDQIGKGVDPKTGKDSKVDIKDDASARLLARLTGDLKGAFADTKDAGGRPAFSDGALAAMGKYLSTSSPKELSRIKPDEIKSIAPKGSKAADVIALSMKLTTVKSLNRNAETSDLAAELKHIVDAAAEAVDKGSSTLTAPQQEQVTAVSGKMNNDLETQDL